MCFERDSVDLSLIKMEESNIRNIVSQLEAIIGVKIPEGTLRRWASEGLIPKPELEVRGDKQDRLWLWPPATVEQAAVVYTLRNKDLPWGRTKKGKNATISRNMLLEAKKMVQHLYASVNKGKIESADVSDMFHLLKAVTLLPNGGCMFGGYAIHPVFTAWVTTLEKIRRGKPLVEPLKVLFSWRVDIEQEDDEESLKLKYMGITVEPSKCEIVGFSIGKFTAGAWLKKFGTEPIDWENAQRENLVLTLDNLAQVQEDAQHQQIIVTDPFTRVTIAIKRADPAEWGPPPWET